MTPVIVTRTFRVWIGIAFIGITAQFGCAQTPTGISGPRVERGIAFQPRGFDEVPVVAYPSAESVRKDLELLSSFGFRSLLTYGAADVLGQVPMMARESGFDGFLVMGIWDPTSAEEIQNALDQAEFVDAYCVGNEGLDVHYNRSELLAAMTKVREMTGRPVTTSEPIDKYLSGADAEWLIEESDWVFPIAHPALAVRESGKDAVNWLTLRYDFLAARTSKRIMIKELGFPTGGALWATPEAQREFFSVVQDSAFDSFYFEAFDQPNKAQRGPEPRVENNWGLFRADGTPKPAMTWLQETWTSR